MPRRAYVWCDQVDGWCYCFVLDRFMRQWLHSALRYVPPDEFLASWKAKYERA